MTEKSQKTFTDVLESVPKSFPSLLRADKIQKKAKKVGFDFIEIDDIIAKVKEELDEVLEAYSSGNKEEISKEIGDLLFSVVNFSRFFGLNSEICLTNTIEKFIKRFEYIETKAADSGVLLENMSLEEMDRLWNEAKNLKRG